MNRPQTYSIQDFLNTTNYAGASFSADNRTILVSSNASGIYNAYQIRIQDGTIEPLTHSTLSLRPVLIMRHILLLGFSVNCLPVVGFLHELSSAIAQGLLQVLIRHQLHN